MPKKPIKQVARDFPAFNTLAVKGRPTLDRSRFEQATRGTGARWSNGIASAKQSTDVWRYVCPVTGKVSYASTKGGKGWHKWR